MNPTLIFTYFKTFTKKTFLLLTYARRHHSLIVIRVDTHIVTLEVKGKLAVFDVLQFILMQVRPPPEPGIDYMRKPFTSSHLRTTTTMRKNTRKQNEFIPKITVLTAQVKG